MPCSWGGNRRSNVVLGMHHKLKWFIHRRVHCLDRDMSTPRTLSCGVGLPVRAQRRPASRSTPASPYFATHAHPVSALLLLTPFSASSALISALLACSACTALYLIINRLFSYANVSQGSAAIYTRCGGILLTSLLQIYKRIYHRRDCENQLRFHKGLIMVMTFGVSFFGLTCRPTFDPVRC